MCLRKSTFLSLFSENGLNVSESGISFKQIGRDCKQPSLFRIGLQYLLPLISTQPGNSSTETFSLTHAQIHPISSSVILPFFQTMVP